MDDTVLFLHVLTFCWEWTFNIIYCGRFGYQFLIATSPGLVDVCSFGFLVIWLNHFSNVYFPCSIQPLVLLFRKHRLEHVHIHPEFIVILAGLAFTVLLIFLLICLSLLAWHPDVGLQKLLTDFLLFLTMSWNTNCFTSDFASHQI